MGFLPVILMGVYQARPTETKQHRGNFKLYLRFCLIKEFFDWCVAFLP
jgi:hypothetical protein